VRYIYTNIVNEKEIMKKVPVISMKRGSFTIHNQGLTCRYFADRKTEGESLPLYCRTCNFSTCDIERKAMNATHTMFVWRTRTAMVAVKNFTHYNYYSLGTQ